MRDRNSCRPGVLTGIWNNAPPNSSIFFGSRAEVMSNSRRFSPTKQADVMLTAGSGMCYNTLPLGSCRMSALPAQRADHTQPS